jgi:RNA-binding protein YlmH
LDIYSHFRKDEKDFIDYILDLKDIVENQFIIKRTSFLTPREQNIMMSIIGLKGQLGVKFNGGLENTERKRGIIYPEYLPVDESDFMLTFFEVKYPTKFHAIDHRDVLGSLMALGLKREKFGDILIKDNRIQLVVASEIASYIKLQIKQIGKSPVDIYEIDKKDLIETGNEWIEKKGTISSNRLDVVLSEVYNLSRQKSQDFIRSKNVQVNYKIIEKQDYLVENDDLISLRKHGRVKILSICEKTAKDRLRVVYSTLR